jgi:nanoRNase/pAp phosphatase (c-di-AMP/oligoRNAs hydrolase)
MICFHHNDADGKAAAAIVRKYMHSLHGPDWEGKFIEGDWSSGNNLDPFHPTFEPLEIKASEAIFIVDFHFNPQVMEKLFARTPYIYVYDHHEGAREAVEQYPRGIQITCDFENSYSACELVWNSLFPNKEMPEAIKLIGDRDKWAWRYGKRTADFTTGLMLHEHGPECAIWSDLLEEKNSIRQVWVDDICKEGEICSRYRNAICKEFRDTFGHEVEFEGFHCYVQNFMLVSAVSESFGDMKDKYDICIAMVWFGNEWKFSLRSTKGIDVSKIAKKYGGGGHASAAGFTLSFVPWEEY